MSAMMPGQQGAPSTQGNPMSQAQGGQDDPNDPSQDQPAAPPGQTGPGGAIPVGTVDQRAEMATQQDPTAKVPATKQEQSEYDDFTSQFLLFISNQKPGGKNLSGHQSTMRQLNDPKIPAAVAVGKTVAMIAMIIVKHAEHQGKKYDPNVLFHANVECCVSVYMLGKAAGIFKNIQPMEAPDKDGNYTFDNSDIRVIADSQIQAIKFFGNMMIHQGLLSQDVQSANKVFWQKQVQREITSGQVPQRVFDMLEKTGAMQHMQNHVENAVQNATQGQMNSPTGADQNAGTAGMVAQQGQQPQQSGPQPGLTPGGP